MSAAQTVQAVVDQHLCLGCGTCVYACPAGAIAMQETSGGLLAAQIDAARCTQCGLCVRVCPGLGVSHAIHKPSVDPFLGEARAAYCGKCADVSLLAQAQSGGLVTATLCHLLEVGRIRRAIVTVMPEDGSLRPKAIVADSVMGIRRAVGSKYCPVDVNSTLRAVIGLEGPTAFVGLPCHVHGLRNLMAQGLIDASDFWPVIGIACEGVLRFGAMDYLLWHAHVRRRDVASLRFRCKKLRGWPGDTRIVRKDGRELYVLNRVRVDAKDAFRPPRCMLCWDKLNVASDLVMSDPWGVCEGAEGASLVLVRTLAGENALAAPCQAGEVILEPIDVSLFFEGMAVEARRTAWTAYTRAWCEAGRAIPDLGIDVQWHATVPPAVVSEHARRMEWSIKLSSKRTRGAVTRAARSFLRRRARRRYWKRQARRIRRVLHRFGRG